MSIRDVNNYIDKLHFRTYSHVVDKVITQFPTIAKKELKKIVDDRLKDHFVKLRKIEPYYIKIFSATPNCWFHDLMENGCRADPSITSGLLNKPLAEKESTKLPRYWHIFIGTNNHYAVALPLKDKRATSIRETLREFIERYHPSKLTSDEEPGFVEKNNIKLLTDNDVSMHIVTDQNHSSLGIIDRFIRTLRDMNIPTEKGSKQSTDDKYRWFSVKRMSKLVGIYNNTYHSRIKCTPQEMLDNPNLEKEYIFKQLAKKEKQETIKDLHLHEGSFVRYIMPRANGKKKRFQFSRECYKIESVNGNMYTLIAQDGTVRDFPRFKIILCQKDGSKPSNCKRGQTFPGKWNGVIKEIRSYNPQTRKYKVIFHVPGKEDYEDEIPETYMRGNFPQQTSEMEKDFVQQNK